MINIIVLFIAFVALLALYQVYRFIVRPKIQLGFYEKQGLPVIFSPLYGFLKLAADDVQKHKDQFYSWKKLNELSPKPRAFASNFGQYPLVALKDPELIKQFYINQEKFYIKAPAAVEIPKLILRNATIVVEGDQWKQHKKLSSVLYNYDNVKELIPEITNIIDERLNKLKEKDLKGINFLTEIQHILLEVTGKLFLGLELSQLQFKGQTVSAFVAELIDRAGLESFEALTLIFGTSFAKMGIHPRQKALVKDIEDLRAFLFGAAKAKLEEILANKDKTANQRPLLLQVIYEQMVKMNDSQLTAVDLVDEFALFTMGMMDTTAHAILFASYYLLQNPTAHQKVLKEAQNTFSDLNKVNVDALNQMEYTNAAIKETLRLSAPLPNFLPRVAVEDHNLGDLKIKAGTVLVVAAVTNSYDSEYHDEPEKFMPERWTDENSKTRKSVSKNAYVYIPFSTGARTCAGQHMGNNVMRILVSLFVKKFEYTFTDKNYEMIYSSKFYIEPQNPLVYNLESRQ